MRADFNPVAFRTRNWLAIGGGVGLLVLVAIIGLALLAGGAYFVSSQKSCVGLMKIEGEISTASSASTVLSGGTIGSDEVGHLAAQAKEMPAVKAVVVEIDSPGGSIVASKEMYDSLKEIHKPKVAYFREVAASGGYYVGAAGDYIVSSPDAITGSIGATAIFHDLSGLFAKLGINETHIKSGELKDIGSSARPLTPKETALIQSIIDEAFQEFSGVVRESRSGKGNFSEASFAIVSDARILTGRQAVGLGLVDQVGNRKVALLAAARLANMSVADGTEPDVCELTLQKNPLETLLTRGAAAMGAGMGKELAAGLRTSLRLAY